MARWLGGPGDCMHRFWEKVDKTFGCWFWTGATYPKGYGLFTFQGRTWRTNRFIWTVTFGAVPEGLFVCHRCDNPSCVKPDHLFLGTHQDNMADMTRKSRRGKGSARGKLTPQTVRGIRTALKGTSTQHEIARQFGVNQSTIRDIKHRYTWKHV